MKKAFRGKSSNRQKPFLQIRVSSAEGTFSSLLGRASAQLQPLRAPRAPHGRDPGAGRLTCCAVSALLASVGLSRLSCGSFLGSLKLPFRTHTPHGGSNHVGHLAEAQGAQTLHRLLSQVLQETPDKCFWGAHTKASTEDTKEGQSALERGGKRAIPNRGTVGTQKLSREMGFNEEQQKFSK